MITIELVFIGQEQYIESISCAEKVTLIKAINCSKLVKQNPQIKDRELYAYGVFGEVKDDGYILQEGDRIEIYSQLPNDPKELRRKKAKNS